MGKVGVVIPVYNRVESAIRAINSIREQTVAVDEMIVVDDGSTIDLCSVRTQVEKAGGKWIALPENRGVAAARNAGVAETDCAWLCFLDSDDVWLPHKTERQMEWHGENESIRISQVQEEWIRNDTTVKKPAHWRQEGGHIFEHSVQRCSVSPSCVMIHRKLWDQTGGFDESFPVCEDYDLWLRISKGDSVGLVGGGPLVRKHGGHGDQLSEAIPAMDRFRIAALLKLLANGGLSAAQESLVREAISVKATIVAAGAGKREEKSRFQLYTGIAKQSAAKERLDLQGWIKKVRAEIESSDFAGPA